MATFTTIKNRGGGRGALAGVLQYIRQDEKTLWEGHRLVSGWNCTAPTAWQEIQLTKERFVKTDGWQYYHFVQLILSVQFSVLFFKISLSLDIYFSFCNTCR